MFGKNERTSLSQQSINFDFQSFKSLNFVREFKAAAVAFFIQSVSTEKKFTKNLGFENCLEGVCNKSFYTGKLL